MQAMKAAAMKAGEAMLFLPSMAVWSKKKGFEARQVETVLDGLMDVAAGELKKKGE